MGERMRERKHLVKSIDEGINLVMNSTEDEPFALIERSQALRAHRAKMGLCHLHIMKAQVSVQEIGIAYGKSFALHEPFTRVLNKIISSGEMNDILNYWTVAKDPCLTVPSSGKPQQISYLHFSGPLVMIAASIPLSMIFIGVKLFHYKRCGLDKRYTGATETSPAVRPVGCIG
ncbi:uncharacterized protein LOC141913215 [Tubulanus polymorphus]|uniref:uncharacterized protein LOC141913215 n=1 Tax=Tubulanus polymorphus TaxID=672921 RepID=UPI003DA26273